MKELNIKNFKQFVEAKKEDYLNRVKTGEISYKRYAAFINEFQFNEILRKINYAISKYNYAEANNNKIYMAINKRELLCRLGSLKAKVQKWN
jgi:hypothetical protein